jgi:hypothetical protein
MASSEDQGLYNLFTTQFSTNLELKLQQMGTLLRPHVKEGFHVGKQASPINQIAPIASRSPAGRFAPMERVDPDFTRRWVFPTDKEIPQLIDSFDELKTIVDPKSQYSENAAMSAGRDWDDALIAAALGTAQVGQDAGGLTSETWPVAPGSATSTSVIIAVSFAAGSTAVGLTVAKLVEARRLLRKFHNDLDRDPPTLIIGSQQEADLLNQVTVVSTEFSDRPVLVDGMIKRFLGFNIVVSERLNVVSNVRKVICFVKSGLYLGVWRDLTNRVSIRNDLSSEPYQLYTKYTYGATRTQPGKVLEIDCSDTTGVDIAP